MAIDVENMTPKELKAIKDYIRDQLVNDYLVDFGIPFDRYECSVEIGPYVSSAEFINDADASIVIREIWIDDEGTISQVGSNYGALVY